jgi:hypothetical protein
MINTFPTDWFHGSPLCLKVLRAGSTITPLYDLARVFSHKPAIVSLEEVEGVIYLQHTGRLPGWLYRVLDVTDGVAYPHPRTSMPQGLEWLTRVDLQLELVGSTELRAEEFLDEAKITRLRGE